MCVDNGEWTRNGDFTPTRFEAQQDAINLLAGVKTEANAENTVGVITMAGDSPQVIGLEVVASCYPLVCHANARLSSRRQHTRHTVPLHEEVGTSAFWAVMEMVLLANKSLDCVARTSCPVLRSALPGIGGMGLCGFNFGHLTARNPPTV